MGLSVREAQVRGSSNCIRRVPRMLATSWMPSDGARQEPAVEAEPITSTPLRALPPVSN